LPVLCRIVFLAAELTDLCGKIVNNSDWLPHSVVTLYRDAPWPSSPLFTEHAFHRSFLLVR